MPHELELTYPGDASLYALIRRRDDAMVYAVAAETFVTWSDESVADYAITLNSKGGDVYQADWPDDITAGRYRVIYYRQDGESPATDDLLLAADDVYWDGRALAPPDNAGLDPYALVDLAATKRFLHLDDAAEDVLLVELINRITAFIETTCSRRFKCRTHRESRKLAGARSLLLMQYPTLALHRLAIGEAPAMHVQFAGSAIRARVRVDNSTIHLTTTDAAGQVTVTPIAFDDYPTTDLLAGAINEVTGWAATAVVNIPACELHAQPDRSVLGASTPLTFADVELPIDRIEPVSGIVRFAGSWTGRCFIRYDAGYATTPADVQLVALQLVQSVFHAARHDPTARRETAGAYSYWQHDPLTLSAAQVERLRPYAAVAISQEAIA